MQAKVRQISNRPLQTSRVRQIPHRAIPEPGTKLYDNAVSFLEFTDILEIKLTVRVKERSVK